MPQSRITTPSEWELAPVTLGAKACIRALCGVFVPPSRYIVILEPDELIRGLLERWVRGAGYQTVLAENHSHPMVKPRLVIADISEPSSAGDTIEALRAAYAAPILALSARFRRGLSSSTEPAQRLHVEGVLPKPFTRQQLLRAVRETLNTA